MESVGGDTEDSEVRICIDGKQRCTSILFFVDGRIPFISPGTKEKFWYSKYGNKKSGKQLPPALIRKFEQITIQAVEYDGLKDAQQRDIFRELSSSFLLLYSLSCRLPLCSRSMHVER